jgi:hypothetical protein
MAERREINKEIAEDHLRPLVEDARKPVQKGPIAQLRAFGVAILSYPKALYRQFSGDLPKKYAREMETVDNPDARREGILKLVSYPFARKPPYTTRYEQIAAEPDLDYTVRAAAIRALNRARDKSATKIFIRYLDDRDFLVRLEAAKALANIPDEKAVPGLLRHLDSDDNKDVRIACADALRNFRTPEVSRALIDELPSRDFSVAWQSHRCLVIMTGRDYRYDVAAWLKFFNESQRPFLD